MNLVKSWPQAARLLLRCARVFKTGGKIQPEEMPHNYG